MTGKDMGRSVYLRDATRELAIPLYISFIDHRESADNDRELLKRAIEGAATFIVEFDETYAEYLEEVKKSNE